MQDKIRPTAGRDTIDVPYVARLAHLELTQEETALFQQQLEKALECVRELAAMDVDNAEPMIQVIPLSNRLRQDQPRPGLSREEALVNAPRHDGEQFVVPKIV
ncbi:MAG: Asp-tRNA(Asn)/Glu-tRNA(Gln) amidotransferase subunit GatC [Kiritimatiellia bacterium]|jgi:aspartyl-tRNA(Asn)/glutamyl-tRNA(Gln) amidotransferase subunit C